MPQNSTTGGGGGLCQTHIFGFGTVIEDIFERELFLVEIPNYLQMFQRGAKKINSAIEAEGQGER